ncbi:PDZ-binding protein [Gilbertella persicaria]|uniref:PDZ-binding protein n=1 Tax=Gilbertella persicaria TaxID=101096 RepID=UPI00221F2E35|nr:PDZ-binding protein [Gilbertella persicaria]KAI8079082.1 PDZ-binding protein [Gilbertella persicaria]
MVCKKCEKKLTTLATPDKWKDGAKNVVPGSSGRKLNQNKLLSRSAKIRFDPLQANKCRICKNKLHQDKAHYCQECAYKKGICSMCGKQVLDTTAYKQTSK